MNRIRMIAVLSLSALALVVAFGALAYRSVSAATPTPTAVAGNDDTGNAPGDTVEDETTPSQDFHGGRGDMKGGFRGGVSDEDLTAALGITGDELTAARQAAYDTALAQAVEQELITQARADELKSSGKAAPFGDNWQGWLANSGIDFQALLADALGITVDQLQAAYTQAFNARIDQAVTDGTLTQDQADLMKGRRALTADAAFQASMQSAYQAAVNQAVADGVITQAQADLILAQAADMGAAAPVPGFGGQPFGGPDGFETGQHGGRGR